VVKEANAEGAYVVRESGYGCFSLPIEVYFKNKDEPRKVKFEYDLFLQSEGPAISHVRYEKMTFKNPSEDFRMKLIKGGGVSLDVLIKFNIKLTIHDLLRWEL
jgi:YEATS domain-containing protein 1/3